jgi:hypothetical protein
MCGCLSAALTIFRTAYALCLQAARKSEPRHRDALFKAANLTSMQVFSACLAKGDFISACSCLLLLLTDCDDLQAAQEAVHRACAQLMKGILLAHPPKCDTALLQTVVRFVARNGACTLAVGFVLLILCCGLYAVRDLMSQEMRAVKTLCGKSWRRCFKPTLCIWKTC